MKQMNPAMSSSFDAFSDGEQLPRNQDPFFANAGAFSPNIDPFKSDPFAPKNERSDGFVPTGRKSDVSDMSRFKRSHARSSSLTKDVGPGEGSMFLAQRPTTEKTESNAGAKYRSP
jgi:hypothetical protein